MKFTNKDLYALLFTELSPNQARCNTCLKVCKSGNGYTNQVHHLLNRHPYYQELAVVAFRKGNRFGLFCERPLVRKNAKMEPISAATLQKYIDLLYTYVRDGIALTLPHKFGLVLDGWSSGSRHFIAIMAVFEDPSVSQPKERNPNYDESVQCLTRRFVLLAFCPLEDEEDLGAQSVFDLIADTLSTFDRPWEYILFMIGDNFSVNQAIDAIG
ncbi:hypothetical protein JG688_00017849 [Phytophthora aleatoria]|uniref:BED-type domain-containing protein n=1 Tax=Phytophthora aleatoria TaxID=2496075 RepID=A0A8J5I9R4_9STRA|nr:hypothetical protein JG688_00017849 [Phytophthora aleatoria]